MAVIRIDLFAEQVAAALGANLGYNIEETVIMLPIHAGRGQQMVKDRVPNFEDLPEEQHGARDLAIVYGTAIAMLPWWKLNYRKVDQTPAAKTEWFEVDWDKLEDELNKAFGELIGELNPEYLDELLNAMPTGFKLTKPCLDDNRGRCC